ncbi:MAG: type IV pilus modification protein PilV [Sideroxydans sp.]|nr:type IV pilus modification protein PilV [Sideroxydans sp.]
MKNNQYNLHINKQSGSSMIEILVTLIIVAIALLGAAGLQIYAMRVNQGGQFRSQAVFLASDIAERMETNKSAAINGSYALGNTGSVSAVSSACNTAACDPASLAAYDLNQWGNTITNLLPQPSWQINHSTTGNPSTYDIVIRWTDRSSDKNSHGETFAYTSTRTIRN